MTVMMNHRRREGRGRIRRAKREISRKNPRLQKRLPLMIAIVSKKINFSCQENVLLWTYIYIFALQGRYFVIIFRKVFHCELSHFY